MNDTLIAQAELGEEAKNFLASDLGKVIIGACKQDAQIALEKLSRVNPSNTESVRALQNEVLLNQMFEAHLLQILQDGEQAIAIWKQNQEVS